MHCQYRGCVLHTSSGAAKIHPHTKQSQTNSAQIVICYINAKWKNKSNLSFSNDVIPFLSNEEIFHFLSFNYRTMILN